MEVESNDFWETGGGKLRLLGEWRGEKELSVDSRGRVRSVDGVIKYYMEREGGEKGLLGLGKRKNR